MNQAEELLNSMSSEIPIHSHPVPDTDTYFIIDPITRQIENTNPKPVVVMQYDHEGRVFARLSNGTLQLESDEHGLKVRADLSGTELGRNLYEEIKGGYTTKMSFASMPILSAQYVLMSAPPIC